MHPRSNKEEVILQYVYIQHELNFYNLIGIHFLNKTIESATSHNLLKALEYAEKAHDYYVSSESILMLSAILFDLIKSVMDSPMKFPSSLCNFIKSIPLNRMPEANLFCSCFGNEMVLALSILKFHLFDGSNSNVQYAISSPSKDVPDIVPITLYRLIYLKS